MGAFFDSLNDCAIGSVTLGVILSALLTLIVCVIAVKIITRIISRALKHSRMNDAVRGYVVSALKILLWVLTVIIVADSLGISTTSLVAVLSVVGVALSLSIQGTLENVFSGITILSTKPFIVGHYIDIGGTAGTVSSVGLFHTVIVTNDRKTIYIPNSMAASSKVINYSATQNRRIDLTVSASYSDATEAVKSALLEAAAETAGVLTDPAPVASVSAYGSSSIEYFLFAWTETDKYLTVKMALTEKLRDSFLKNGITMTYDHLNVHIAEKEQTPEDTHAD